MKLTEREKTAFARYNYDDVILYLRGAGGMLPKRWQISEFGELIITMSDRMHRADLLAFAAAVPNDFAVCYTFEDAEGKQTGLLLRVQPSPKTSDRTPADWL